MYSIRTGTCTCTCIRTCMCIHNMCIYIVYICIYIYVYICLCMYSLSVYEDGHVDQRLGVRGDCRSNDVQPAAYASICHATDHPSTPTPSFCCCHTCGDRVLVEPRLFGMARHEGGGLSGVHASDNSTLQGTKQPEILFLYSIPY